MFPRTCSARGPLGWRRCLAALACGCCLTVAAGQAAPIVLLSPLADRAAYDWSTIYGTLLDNVFDEFTSEFAGNVQYMGVLRVPSPYDITARSALEFAMPEVAESHLLQAVLSVRLAARSHDPDTAVELVAHGYAGNGVIDLADFAAENEVGRQPIGDSIFPPPALEYDVTDFVRGLYAVGASHAGFAFRTEQLATLALASSEFGDPAYRPHLRLEFAPVPEPGAATLALGAAAWVLIGCRRRRAA